MKLTDVVKKHGFKPSELAEIKNAKLYQRVNPDGVNELLCVQKIGNVMRIDRLAVMNWDGMVLPVGQPVNQILPKEDVEGYLDTTLVAV